MASLLVVLVCGLFIIVIVIVIVKVVVVWIISHDFMVVIVVIGVARGYVLIVLVLFEFLDELVKLREAVLAELGYLLDVEGC